MKHIFALATLSLVSSFSPNLAVSQEDHPLVGRYEGTSIVHQDEMSFGAFPFVTNATSPTAIEIQELEGQITHHTYVTGTDDTVLRVARNFEAALARDGFGIQFSCAKVECGSNIPKDVLAKDPQRLARLYAGYVPGSLGGFSYLTTQAS